MATPESVGEDNFLKWSKFLAPLKGLYRRETKEKNDTHTLGSEPCLSREVALKFDHLVNIQMEELHQYEIRKEATKRNLTGAFGDDAENTNDNKFVKTTSMDKTTLTTIKSDTSLLQGRTYSRPVPCESFETVSNKPFVMLSSQLPHEFSGTVTSAASKTPPGYVKTNVQDDRSITLSKWNLDKFVKYVNFDRVVKLNITFEEKSHSKLKAYVGNLYKDSRAIFGADDLTRCIFKEAQSRVVIDMLIFKISKFHDITVKLEEDVKFDFLPGGKLDYYFKNKDGVPIGCLEAKSPKTMNKDAFVQLVMELFMVQQMAEKRGVVVSESPIFGILSDGIRFVLIQLKGNNLFLEHDGDVIKIRDINSERSGQELLAALSYLIISSKQPKERL